MANHRRLPYSALLAFCATFSVAIVDPSSAQSPYASTPAATQAWGGYAVAQQVPYQPMLGPAPNAAGAQPSPIFTTAAPPPGTPYTLAAPVALPSEQPTAPTLTPAWQPYPGAGAPVPASPPGYPLQEPVYPATPEAWDLKASLIPPDARNGFFQKAKFTGTYLPQLGSDSLGWTDLRSEVVTALPFFTRENPILITPSYEVHFLDRPDGFDLPPRLHDLVMDFHVFRVYDNRWIFDVAVTPGLYADDHSFDSNDAFRFNGRAVAVYAPSPEWKWLLGATYLNGAWAKVVPIAGFVYEPNDDVIYEAVFPQPRVAWRLPSSPVPGRDEYWFYLLGEFANSIWAFEQTDGTPDVLAYRDFRFIAGLERKVVGGLSYRGEVGWVFNRDIKLASRGDHDIGMGDTFLVRLGLVY
jgi:hypothetical protein